MATAGVGGPITGKGAHLLIVDDPIKNDEEASSTTHRPKGWDWWQSTASTRLGSQNERAALAGDKTAGVGGTHGPAGAGARRRSLAGSI